MKAYTAEWVLPMAGEPLHRGSISIENGRIVSVDEDAGASARDLGHVAIMPALVNAHTHLELSYLHGRVARTEAFLDRLTLVLGASFSNHTSIATWVPTIQVDLDRMILGKFHPVEVPLWGDIGRTLGLLAAALPAAERPAQRATVAQRWARWRKEKAHRETLTDHQGRLHPALVFAELSAVCPEDAVIAVDVGNNTYSFGRFFECRGRQDVLMSGYLGSIGFGLPAALGAYAATGTAISMMADQMPGAHVNAIIESAQQGNVSALRVFEDAGLHLGWGLATVTNLINPDFCQYARLCGGTGFSVRTPGELRQALEAALAHADGPSLVEIHSSAKDV